MSSKEHGAKERVPLRTISPRRIAVGVDGSTGSIRALRRALQRAKATGASVLVVRAWHWPDVVRWDLPRTAPRSPEAAIAAQLEQLLCPIRLEHPEVDIQTMVVEGHPVPVLVEASTGSELLVLGGRHVAALGGTSAESVSQHCVTHARCPVLVLRDE